MSFDIQLSLFRIASGASGLLLLNLKNRDVEGAFASALLGVDGLLVGFRGRKGRVQAARNPDQPRDTTSRPPTPISQQMCPIAASSVGPQIYPRPQISIVDEV